ncbi:hypothetical protein [Inquilinus sp.]|jgi:hypothetical protein|uniref:hypothetical protein n=1 Tax=Inquilinus sp. TaxID=1932117 RepID=UPI003784EA3E
MIRTGKRRGLRAFGLVSALVLAAVATENRAWAWGHTGHVTIGEIAADNLPWQIKAMLGWQADTAISEWNAELDVSKGAGQAHDFERDPGHFIDIDDAGKVLGGVDFNAMPVSRRDFDTALRAGGQTQYGAGYLYYSMIDGWQQVRMDFAWMRALTVGLRTASNRADREFFQTQLELRRKLLLRDIGVWGHYVADGSQPMHVSVHFNGWGNWPNPNNYTNAPIHGPFEGTFVKSFVGERAIRAALPRYRDCSCQIEQRVHDYLQTTLGTVERTYQLAPSTNNYTTPTPVAVGFVAQRVAAGAAEMRDMVIDAWKSSATWTVGFPAIKVSDIESGKVKVTRDSFWHD